MPGPALSIFEQLYFQCRRLAERTVKDRSDIINPLCILALATIGVTFVYSAQSYSGGQDWQKQCVWLLLGAGIYTAVSSVNYKLFLQNAHYLYGASVLLLIPLFLQAGFNIPVPLVVENNGSTRWINLGFMSVQPSEIAKIGMLVMVASLLARSEIGTLAQSLTALVKVAVASLIPFLLIFAQPDLGSCLVFPPMVFAMLYVSRLSQRFFITAIALFVLAVGLVGLDLWRYYNYFEARDLSFTEDRGAYQDHSWLPMKDYQRNRILSFLAPDLVDPGGIGVSWNQRQALISVATGGATGKGLGEGTQAKLGYLPSLVAPTDFIYSVLAEEKGFLGGVVVIGLYATLMANTLRIASMARDRFGMLLCIGVAVMFMMHVFINIGMNIGMMPITGLPLPFISYGGSFVVVCCLLQGLVQSVYRFRRDFS